MDEHKKPGWAFWTTVAIAVPVLYVASFGPACWITSQFDFGAETVPVVYQPLAWESVNLHGLIANALKRYALIGAAEEWSWRVQGYKKTNAAETNYRLIWAGPRRP